MKLKPYNPNFLDVSVLWTTGFDFGHGFRFIQTVDNVNLKFDAYQQEDQPDASNNLGRPPFDHLEFEDTEDRGGEMRDGARIGISHCHEGDSLLWKIVPWCKFLCISSC